MGREEGSNNSDTKPKAYSTENELHVKGLLFESTEEEILAYFEKFGKVNSINILKGSYGSGHKGIAFVRMEDEKGVEESIAHSGEEFMGRKIWIDKSKTREERHANGNYGGYKNNNNYGGYNNYNNNRYGQQNRNRGNFYENNNQNELVAKGLSYNSSEDDVWNYFDSFGKVRSLNLLKRPDGSSKGIAFVRMATRTGYFRAQNSNGQQFMGRQVWINNANQKYGNNNYQFKNYNNYNNNNYNNYNNYNNQGNFNGPKKVYENQAQTIFVGNLSWNTTDDMLKGIFEPCGKVADVRLARKPDGRSRGFAYVEFETEEAVKKALEMVGTKLDEREINIDKNVQGNQNQGQGQRGGYQNGNRRGNYRGGRGNYY